MEKLRFEFSLLPSSDGKSNVYCITSISTPDERSYAIPEEFRSLTYHKEITNTDTFKKIKNSLKKRYQVRKVWIKITSDLKKIYIDDEDNLQFENQYLEELNDKNQAATAKQSETSTWEKILEKLVENTESKEQYNLRNIADKFVIEKFSNRNTNASQWMEFFERECVRFKVIADEKKIEILRLFMDKSCMDWYSSMIIKLTLDSEWAVWKQKFCDSFANKGWSAATYALSYKYKEGSILEYAMKKEKLLLDMRRSIDTGTLVDLVATGLPQFILNKIDREAITDTTELYNEIGKYEHMVNKSNSFIKRKPVNQKSYDNTKSQKACGICEKLNKGTRYHPEDRCWFKSKDGSQGNLIKHVNNSEIEAELVGINPKNE